MSDFSFDDVVEAPPTAEPVVSEGATPSQAPLIQDRPGSEFSFDELQLDEVSTVLKAAQPKTSDTDFGFKSKFTQWLNQPQEPGAWSEDQYVAAVDPDVAKELSTGNYITAGDVNRTFVAGLKETFGNTNDSWLWKGLTFLTSGEQYVARSIVAALANMDKMPMKDARAILSQDEVHGSNIVDYFMTTTTKGGRVAEMGAGLLADILLDPMTYITRGATAKYKVGKETYNFYKYNRYEQNLIRAAKKLETKISDAPFPLADKEVALSKINKSLELAIKGDKEQLAVLRPDVPTVNQSVSERLAEGSEVIKIRLPIPFVSNVARDVELPMISRLTGSSVLKVKAAAGDLGQAIDTGLSKVDNLTGLPIYDKTKWVTQRFGHYYELMKTQTDYPAFNEARINHINKLRSMRVALQEEELAAYKALAGADENFLAGMTDVIETMDGINYLDPTPIMPAQVILPPEMDSKPISKAAREFIAKQINDNKNMSIAFKEKFPWYEPFKGKDPNDAKAYVKHYLSKEWLKLYDDDLLEAQEEAFKMIQRYSPASDASAFKRTMNQTIKASNQEAMAKKNIKMYIDDPVKLHYIRMNEMQRIMLNHDTLDQMKDVVSTEKMPGYVPLFNREQEKLYLKIKKDPDELWGDADFLPGWMRKKLADGERMYVPEQIKPRMDYLLNTKVLRGDPAFLMRTLNTYNHLFRNSVLYGPSYWGQNFFGNLITYQFAGGDTITGIKAATAWATKSGITLNKRRYSHDEWVDLLNQNGVLQTSLADEVNWELMVDNMAARTTDKVKRAGKYVAAGTLEIGTGWRTNRMMSRIGDDLPKIMYFSSLIDQGYSVKGARDAMDFWFFNFADITPAQSVARQVFPFTTFALKTKEQAFANLAKGDFGTLTMPVKVSQVLEGAYVDDHDTRMFLDDQLPQYRQFWSNIHGPLIPGGKEIAIDIPWATSTLSFIFNPENSLHPMFKLMSLRLSSSGKEHSDILGDEQGFFAGLGQELQKLTPPPVHHVMAMLELSGAADVPMFNLPKTAQIIPDESKRTGAFSYNEFDNAEQFGRWMRETYGDNWLYNFFFYGDFKDRTQKEDSIAQMTQDARYGAYIKRYFRDLTFGLARIEDMDRNTFFNYRAIEISKAKLKSKFDAEQLIAGGIADPDVWNDPKKQDEMMKSRNDRLRTLMAEIRALEDKQSAIINYYGHYLMRKETSPGFFYELFGLGEDNYSFEKIPAQENVWDTPDLREQYIQEMREEDVQF